MIPPALTNVLQNPTISDKKGCAQGHRRREKRRGQAHLCGEKKWALRFAGTRGYEGTARPVGVQCLEHTDFCTHRLRCDLLNLDRLEVHHITTDSLGGVELHKRLRGERIPQNSDAEAVHYGVRFAEIAKRNC